MSDNKSDDPLWGQRRFDDPDRKPEEPFIIFATKEQMEALEASVIEARLAHPRPDENRAFTKRVLGENAE